MGEDVLLVERAVLQGRDAFGKEAPAERVALAVNRADQPRSVEYEKTTWEIPAQSALWLEK